MQVTEAAPFIEEPHTSSAAAVTAVTEEEEQTETTTAKEQEPQAAEATNKSTGDGEESPNQQDMSMLVHVKAALDEWSLNYQQIDADKCEPGNQIIIFNLNAKSANFRCLLSMMTTDERFAVYFTSPIKVPEEHRPKVAEYIVRVNYGIMIGHLDMDFSDGEVRFKASTDVQGTQLSKDMVKQMIGSSLKALERRWDYWIRLNTMRVIYWEELPWVLLLVWGSWRSSRS